MRKQLMGMTALIALAIGVGFAGTNQALADGELHIYNWGDYTNPKLIDKFSKQYNVKVTLDDYDSNETMLSKVREGNTGYDIVVPSDYTVKIMVDDGLLENGRPPSGLSPRPPRHRTYRSRPSPRGEGRALAPAANPEIPI